MKTLSVHARPAVAVVEVIEEMPQVTRLEENAPNATPLCHEAIANRIREALAQKSIRAIAHETDSCPETVRRYLGGAACSVEFVTQLCMRYGLCADWVLFGRGPMYFADSELHPLQSNSITDLLGEVARRWQAIESSCPERD